MKLQVLKGTTSKRVAIFVQDSSQTDGRGLAGLVWNTASLAWYYWREDEGNAAATVVTLATMTRGTWATGGFVEKDATNMPGFYEIGIPNAALATGAHWVVMRLGGAANMAPVTLEIELTNLNNQDGVRAGLTALPNAAADAAGGLPISDAGGLDLDTQIGTDIDAILVDTAEIGAAGAGLTGLPAVTLANGAHGGAAATLTLLSVVLNNTGGSGLKIDGTTHGIEVAASAGPGIEVDGTTFGLQVDASAGPGAHLGGTTIGLDVDASAGVGFDIDGTTGGMTINATSGSAVYAASSGFYGLYVTSAATHGVLLESAGGGGNGLYASGNAAGAGALLEGGATGAGLRATGGATSGDGIYASSPTLGDGIEAAGAGGGYDVNADIQGSVSGSVGSTGGTVTLANGAHGGAAATITLATPVQANLAGIKTTALPAESAVGRDAAALGKFLDVVTPLLDCSAAMRGTDGAYTGTPPTAAQNADAVLDEAVAGHAGFLTTLALEATLTAIKGAGWSTETLKAIKDAVDPGVSAPTTAQIVTALKASTGWTAVGTETFTTIVKALRAAARGKITVAAGVYTVYDDDGTTALFTFTPSTGATTRAVT